jgi:intracellular sulfur oxidation DsrE/DsrF family protein
MNIIIHIDEMAKWPMVLNNLKHLSEAYHAPTDQIELLVNGDAVNGVKTDSAEAKDIQDALTSQTTLAVCKNSLNQRGIANNDLLPDAKIVPAGVVELVEKQALGFHYLRP